MAISYDRLNSYKLINVEVKAISGQDFPWLATDREPSGSTRPERSKLVDLVRSLRPPKVFVELQQLYCLRLTRQ